MKKSASVIAWIVVVFLGTGILTGQPVEKRVALVIGNGAYEHLPRLANPGNDVRDLSSTLASLGFEVITLIDADQNEMFEAVEEFSITLSSGNGVGMFYYAGHGVQSGGSNYLLPVDVEIQRETQLRVRAVDARLVFDYMSDAGNPLNMIILDACRNNPFEDGTFRSATRGLARIEELPKGSIIVYATQPGNVAEDGTGRNGTFTKALLKHITTPNLDVMQLFQQVGADVSLATNDRQRPWINHDFYGRFLFSEEGEPPVKDNSLQAAAPKQDGQSTDETAMLVDQSTVQIGELYIVTNPPGATVHINGEEKGKSPILLKDIPLRTELRVQAIRDTMIQEERIRLVETFTHLTLELSHETGRLVILSEEENVNVFIDGEDVGSLGAGIFENVTSGEHEIKLLGQGIYYTGTVEVVRDATVQLRAEYYEVGSLRLVIPPDSTAIVTGGHFRREITYTEVIEHLRIGGYSIETAGSGVIPETTRVRISKGRESSFEARRSYGVGDKGPAGGTIFYDKGVYSDGWRYLEAAPIDQSTGVGWGANKVFDFSRTTTAENIGAGAANTAAIVTKLGDARKTYAALQCDQFVLNDLDNWFLPSKEELNLMYQQKEVIGGFASDFYWSSSEYNSGSAWYQDFDTGRHYNDYGKSANLRLRAVRSF